jgi:ABC-type multidrug transport system fused ATPase/permease subunit
VGIAVVAPLFLIVLVNIVLTLARRPVAARLTSDPQETPKVAASLAVTSFHVAILSMSVVFTVMLMLQVLYANPSRVTSIGPVVALVLFAVFYAQARYLPEKLADQAHRGWRIGAAPGETAEIYAEVFRARSWILAMGLIGPVLVLLVQVFFFGALGDVGQMPAGMLLD